MKSIPFLTRDKLLDVKDSTSQPFLMRFASPIRQDGNLRPPSGTLHTFVERETTDDR